MLKAIYRQLTPGATFAFAVRFPHAAELARRVETPEIWHSYTDATGSQVVVSGTQRYDAATQVMTHETYRQYAVDGTPAATPDRHRGALLVPAGAGGGPGRRPLRGRGHLRRLRRHAADRRDGRDRVRAGRTSARKPESTKR